MIIEKTKSAMDGNVKVEAESWQALADAIIIQAVKDYRNRARMMKRIRGRLKRNKEGRADRDADHQQDRLSQIQGAAAGQVYLHGNLRAGRLCVG